MGGSVREWSVNLVSPVVPGTDFELHLVMTKFDEPAVTIGYQIRLEPFP